MIQRYHGEEVVPKRLRLNADTLALAAEVMALFCAPQGRTRGELEAERQVPEGDQTDYRLKRGLAHLLESAFSPYERRSPLDPAEWRQRAFALSAPSAPSPQRSMAILTAVADMLSRELARDIGPAQVRTWLYADLREQHVLTRLSP